MNAPVESASVWYRQPFVWLLIGIPLSAVIVGLTMLWISIDTFDGLVVDDYYRQGKEINRSLHRDHAATRYGLRAELTLNVAANEAVIELAATHLQTLPNELTLRLWHATRAGNDQVLTLVTTAAGRYRTALPELVPGHWHVQIEADDWRLTGSTQLPGGGRLQLQAAAGGG